MALLKAAMASGRDVQRNVESDLLDRLGQGGAGFLFAAAAAIGTAGARLQLGKAAHAIGGGATDVVIGNGVAQANVHGAHFQRECE